MAGNRAGDERLKAGIDAARRGDRETAQKLLRQVVASKPDNEVAWMWLASVAESLQERRTCLERALAINPRNTRAQEALRQLDAIMPRSGARSQAAGAPRRAGSTQRSNPMFLIIAGLVVLAILAAVVLSGALNPQPEPVTEATLAVFDTLVNTDAPTATIDPDTYTATPFLGVIVAQPTIDRTQPPTFTPTFTPTPLPTVSPTPTPLPLASFSLLYTGLSGAEAQPALYSSSGDGTNPEVIGPPSEVYGDVAYSPNGQKIAFVRTVTYTNTDNIQVTAPELFAAPADDLGAARQITQMGATKLESPSWAPDSIQIVFVSNLGDNDNIWYITDDGNNLSVLTQNSGVDKDPAWSPQGDVILYASDQGGLPGSGITQIFSMAPNGQSVTQLTQSGNSSYTPAWSPTGDRVVFASDRNGDGDIFLMDPDGQSPFLLTVDDSGAEDRQPVFSPDARRVVFLSNREGDTFQLYQVDMTGRLVERVSDISQTIQSFSFLPAAPVLP